MEDNKENLSRISDEELEKLGVVGLKKYLREHNQFVTGRKNDLLKRAIGVGRLNLTDRIQLDEQDAEESRERRSFKLKTPLGECLPDPYKLNDGWTDNVLDIPEFSDRDLYNYIVLKMNAKRHLRAKVYYEDGHVNSVRFHPVSDSCSHCFISCKVMPSLPSVKKSDNPDHSVWLCLSKVTGQVHSADCNCTAGAGEVCNHISALMFALVDITSKKRDGSIAATSSKCLWNNPRKRKMSPKKAQDLKFRRYELGKSATELKDSKEVKCVQNKCVVNINSLRQKLMLTNSKAGWLTFFEESEHLERKSFLEVDFMFHDRVDLKSEAVQTVLQKKMDTIKVDEKECSLIEKETRGQSKSETWKEERKYRLTASNFGSIYRHQSIRCNITPSSILNKLLYSSEVYNRYTTWGKKHEPAARMKYKLIMKKRYKDVAVRECGLFISTEKPYLGASPDGVVMYTDGDVKQCGLLEVKCPASDNWRFLPPELCCRDRNFCSELQNGKSSLKKSHSYYAQVQGQMGVSGYKWCDFVIWTLGGVSIERIVYDPDWWMKCSEALSAFYINSFLPEIFSRRVQRKVPLF